ncbi:MAG: phosphatase PAP2 family protein [Pseudodesulfovibrio sp.]|uniref:Phosphoesterase PA-phosphatase related protein n=1 Tax=Pseudodesulfovibrio aespoeensis (strain ATCC 700646 / DSM 10631 / Aspo-2) TaxID=643562 RepID=E6VUQ4_PSEA9|nr:MULTISPECIES: phosphatase PAP2 family protein [Pseudodesulfovibrio]MBU4192108.1 phosphatase PAP2 family protein [Pseudomonadota bacterium]ADU62295.1 phosphoesterase PA-phosphatase related protein [Pseudodesulfovibrio aespoeensis Aspo-2]MBU4245225.1 phosphatase PAP2 family protein [Pseudomonadota bacterium]MBU4474040.1 phosphatase PAP2 family protein [Pseudomonadota bacterium]MBU4515238.1 phosphatase PAP2 family protein [Pseudomonadota bacterium]
MFFLTPALDLKLFLLVNQEWRCALFDLIMPLLSSMTALMLCLGLAAIYAVIRSGRRQLVYFIILFIAMGLANLSTDMVKSQVKRVRPLNAVAGTFHQAHGHWEQRSPDFAQTKEEGTSYPSAHAANTMCLAALMCLLWPALGKWPLLLPLLVGYSRLYVGKHYPTDILAGWLLGLAVALVVWMVWRYGLSRLLRQD